MRARVRSIPLHPERFLAEQRANFADVMGAEAAERRAAEIAALPEVEWKGQRLRTIRCHGTSGKGPHDRHVPEGLLWALISLQGYLCPFHR